MNSILCKYRGMLVLMEVECGNKKFVKNREWTMCDECGFEALIKKNTDDSK